MKNIFYIILFLTGIYAQFDWQDDGAPIRQGLHIEWQRTGDANSDGSMIYAWSDCRNGIRDVVTQKVDINGNNLWGDYGIVAVNAEGRQEDPQLVIDGAGGAYIIWMDYRDESDVEGDIYAQHVKSDGSLGWGTEGLALVNQPGQQSSPNICSDGQEGAYVIWKDNASSSYGDIYATHLSSSGVIAPGQGVPIITYSSYRSSPSLNTGGSGEAVLIWSDDRNTDEDLYAQRINVESGTINTQWGNEGGKLICDVFGDQTSPRVAQYGGDNTIITWEDGRNSYTDAFYQILDGNGDAQLAVNGVSACSGEWEIIKPRVKAENSVAYIVWEDRRNGWTSDIYAQKISSDGSTAWAEGLEITTSDGSQTEPRLTTDGSSGVYFVWEDQRNADESGIDIYAQHVNESGEISYDSNGEQICNAENKQFNPLVRTDGTGGAFIVWGDQRSGGSYGMYLQHLTNSGTTLAEDGKESFFGISTDAVNEPYNHRVLYLDNNEALVYWQDTRWGASKIYGSKINSSFDGTSDIFSNGDINGDSLTSLPLAQDVPKAILAGNNIFLSFKVEESPNENLYFQLLNIDLSPDGNATAIADPSTSKQGFDMVYGEDGAIYYAYSENYDISIKKIYETGEAEWSVVAVDNSADDIIQSIYPYPGGGCVIIYEFQSFIEGSHIHALAVDENGVVQNGWPVNLSDLSGKQYYESSVLTDNGIFISFKDNTSGDYDVYGQYLQFNGSLMFSTSGEAIASGDNDQKLSSLAYNNEQDEVFVCYEFPNGSELDIHCKEIDLSNQALSEEIVLSSADRDQSKPFVYWSGHSFIIAWEDTRNTVTLNSGVDIYFQEYNNGNYTFPMGGQVITTFHQKQERPIISKYSETENLYLILWEDYRSTGKEFCANLYGQSFRSEGEACPDLGDLNNDGGWNVLDIVQLANCVLADDCVGIENGCAGDMNNDGVFNVLDIVLLANCVLADNCGD